jgi:Tol biopolymer transport system component
MRIGAESVMRATVVLALSAALVLLVAACGGGGQGPEPTETAVPPDIIAPADAIVAGFSDFNSEIYTVAPDGGRLTRITDTPGHAETNPVWAADGRLAFVRWPLFESQDELIVTRADGTEPVRVAGGMDISQPAWSPDGSRIAFVEGAARFYDVDVSSCTRPDSSLDQVPPRLFVADVASGTAVPLIDLVSPDSCVLPFPQPQWSPDGAKIALARRGVYLVDVATGQLTEIVPTGDVVDAAWSPDGQRLAVAVAPSDGDPSGRVLVVGADGQGLVEIARQNEWIHSLAWSPLGDLIAFAAGADEAWLFVVNPDGSGLRSLAQGVKGGLAWSPDGRRLAVALVDPHSSPSDPNIYTVDIDNGATARLTDVAAWEYSPSWSADGSTIAFVSCRDAQGGIFAVHPDGSLTPLVPIHDGEPPEAFLGPDRRLIVPAPASVEGNPLPQGTLSPDGRHLANSVSTGSMLSEGCSGDVRDIYIRNVDGSEITNVTNTPDINEMELAWSPDSRLLALTSGVPPRCHLVPGRLEVMKADGSERRLLADFSSSRGQVEPPEWVAGGSALLFRVAYLAAGALPGPGTPIDKTELYTVNVDGSGLTQIPESPDTRSERLLSPDHTRVAMVEAGTPKGWRVLLGSADGTDMEEVAGGEGELSQFHWWPTSWSPNGTHLAFLECDGDPCQSALFVVNADGSGFRKVVDPFMPYEVPTWFPGGSRLAFVTHPEPCVKGEGTPPGHLEVVNVDGGAPQRVTDRCLVRWILGWPPQ